MATTLFLLPTPIHTNTHHYHHHLYHHNNHNTIFTSHNNNNKQKKHIILNCLPPSQTQTQITQNPQKTNLFLTNQEYKNLQNLNNYTYSCKIPSGYLTIRPMKDPELDTTVALLAESFAESMFFPDDMYVKLLSFLIKQYVVERRGLLPHAVTLLGFLREDENGACDDDERECNEGEFAGTVEVTFNKLGANDSLPTPTPPKDCPYICNMSVKKHLRRRGIGWHLLKASEELISKMSSSRDVYLHCRMIDVAPFKMYTKAGYDVVKTDSFLILLILQRRKHLMCKKLPELTESSEVNIDGENGSFSVVRRESEIMSCDEKPLEVGESVSASE